MNTFIYATEKEADSRETCPEILEACFRVAAEDAGHEDVIEEGGLRIWEAPSDEEKARVLAIAWELADEHEAILFWGPESHTNPRH